MSSGISLFTLGFLYPNENQFHPITTGLVRGTSVAVISYLIGRQQGVDMTFPSTHNFKWQTIRNGIMVVQGLAYA